ncbi:MAG: pyridoxamine 5'-phosphate oxidase family protein [Candidatus Aminicenantes bacterium]|nr:pyridoxamine 5'-phosphate oxidase family protein [Candidatus Aminicenantes bacterium]
MSGILLQAEYITVAMCVGDEPYLVTLNHGYDRDKKCIYFHCARDGNKTKILKKNSRVWGQAVVDKGYVQGACDHLYASIHFKGKVTFVQDINEKRRALVIMIKALEEKPEEVIKKQVTKDSVLNVQIGRIDIEEMYGKKSENVVISL